MGNYNMLKMVVRNLILLQSNIHTNTIRTPTIAFGQD